MAIFSPRPGSRAGLGHGPRQVPLSVPTWCRPTPITTTAVPFAVHCDSVGATVMRLIAG
jgi:hypothetical protein